LVASVPKEQSDRKPLANDPSIQPLFGFVCASAQDICCVLEESNKVLDSLVNEL